LAAAHGGYSTNYIEADYIEIVDALLQAGADAKLRNDKEQTALDVARTEAIRARLLLAEFRPF
jgi:ankyrin repeat protein